MIRKIDEKEISDGKTLLHSDIFTGTGGILVCHSAAGRAGARQERI